MTIDRELFEVIPFAQDRSLLGYFGFSEDTCAISTTVTLLGIFSVAPGDNQCIRLAAEGVTALLNMAAFGSQYIIPSSCKTSVGSEINTLFALYKTIQNALLACDQAGCAALADCLVSANNNEGPGSIYCNELGMPTITVTCGDPISKPCGTVPTDADFPPPTVGEFCGTLESLKVKTKLNDPVYDPNTKTTSYTRTVTVTDGCGGFGECTQTITVKKCGTLSIKCGNNFILPCGSPAPTAADFDRLVGYTPTTTCNITDGGGSAITATARTDNSGFIDYTRTYAVGDDCGQSASCEQKISVKPCPAPSGFHGCDETFWRTPDGQLRWDAFSDIILVRMGLLLAFKPGDDFWRYFQLTPGSFGLSEKLTMLQALFIEGTPGQPCSYLVPQAVAALLSAAAFPNDYRYPLNHTSFKALRLLIIGTFHGVEFTSCEGLALFLRESNTTDQNLKCEALSKGGLFLRKGIKAQPVKKIPTPQQETIAKPPKRTFVPANAK